MDTPHIKVKLYGESFKIHSLEIKDDYYSQFSEIANQLNEPLESALLHVDFFRCLNINHFQTIQDLVKNTFGGLISNNKSQIELWIGRKRVEKFKLEHLFYSQTLFPLFKIQIYEINKMKLKPGLFLEEREVGLIGQYEVITNNFNIDLLKFKLTKFDYSNTAYELLNTIIYDKIEVLPLKTDTLLRYQLCFFIQ